ncbi:preprotein translocase subunit YajC [Novosphingobium sp. G106]|uniref:preprotein translocase subunit YajC n=1 Tax=Novosphingobium sp. G106 TaxID=2849500 RepID=UPI001C2D5160|nr:preprotein translocase subunit YajC [Novosphingobium sp. G106]MBV1687566.1 preprotein translocase subunit YajC [Novosphingobium sp. G106]
MTSRLPWKLAVLASVGACALPLVAAAQSIPYGNVGSGSSGSSSAGSSDDADAPTASGKDGAGTRHGHGGKGSGSYGVKVTPYIEAAQIISARLSPGDDTLTYSVLAAGVDASVAGRNNGASVSLRYEHRFGWGRAEDGDIYSGIANGYATVVPGVTVHAGGLAARSSVEPDGSAVLSPFSQGDSVTQIYSVYAGPSVSTHAGDVAINANYRIGYTKVESPDALTVVPGQSPVDVFDDSVVQLADVHAGVSAGQILPVGLGAGAKYYREDISNLDQRAEDFSARADVTVPVTNTFAVVGGVGYEKVQVSGRDAVRDAAGVPVVGADGRYVTDKSAPRILAYDVSGLIWDAGVIWRPSRRTALEAHIGRRYGSTTYYGSLAYAPSPRSSFNVSVYDNVSGFGGQLNRSLIGLPTDFEAVRNPLSGGVTGCVSSLEGGSCLSGSLGNVRSSVFRARGVMATYNMNFGRMQAGIGAGYDRRKFIGAPGTVLAASSGVIDENYWLAGFVSQRLDASSGIRADVFANWLQSGSSFAGDETAIGATASYYRDLTRHLTASAAVGINGIDREAPLTDEWIASALFGIRYSF